MVPAEIKLLVRGSPHTSQISHLLLYLSLWPLVPGLSSQFLPLFPIQLAIEVSVGQQYCWELATKFYKLREPLLVFANSFPIASIPGIGIVCPSITEVRHCHSI